VKRIAFWNAKGGVGTTTLVFNLAAMFGDLGARVLAADLDPQADLTATCVEQRTLIRWSRHEHPQTIFDAFGGSDVCAIEPYPIAGEPRVALLPGDIAATRLEDRLAQAWFRAIGADREAASLVTVFTRAVDDVANRWQADVVLIDVGAGSSALVRTALLSADAVIFPVSPDAFALEGLRVCGSMLRDWRSAWLGRGADSAEPPAGSSGAMDPMGYVVFDRTVRTTPFVLGSELRLGELRDIYGPCVLGEAAAAELSEAEGHRLAILRNHRGLAALAAEARKPFFALLPADARSEVSKKPCGGRTLSSVPSRS
jgi:chromosome partitioning protein